MIEKQPHENAVRERQQKLLQFVAEHRELYRQKLQRHVQRYGKADKEGWQFFNSRLDADTNTDFEHRSSYFGTGTHAAYSFEGLNDFSKEKLIEYVVTFLSRPENKDRELILLDAFGQGTACLDLRQEILAKNPNAKITIIASTLTPSGNRNDVLEFNGDMLADEPSRAAFNEIDSRRNRGSALYVSFFRPVAALGDQKDNLFVKHSLYTRLRKLFESTASDGLLFIQSTSDGNDIAFLHSLLQRYNAHMILHTKQAGLLSLIVKDDSLLEHSTLPREGGKPVLPSIQDIVEKHWDLVQKYWHVPD